MNERFCNFISSLFYANLARTWRGLRIIIYYIHDPQRNEARLAQLVERKALNLVVVGSSPTVGELVFDFYPHSSRSIEP